MGFKNNIFPEISTPFPVPKKNLHGQLITNPNELKSVYLEHFAFRMRNRPIISELNNYAKDIKVQMNNILNVTKHENSPDWTCQDLDRVLRSLKSSQSPDTMNLVNEIFMMKNIGGNLKMSLLNLFNLMKNNQFIPDFLKDVYITSIPKKLKDPLNLSSERGIFLVPKLRALLSKLIYNSIIDLIEEQLSPSNIGARKHKSPRDHLFVLYAVLNETLKGKHGCCCIDLVFTDVTDCFNSLWTEKTITDLHENGIQSNLLNLIHELSKSATISIKTPVGTTEKKMIEDIIMKGETLSSISCTLSMDRISKESKKETFEYRNSVRIPKMGFIDDLLDLNKCGKQIKEQHHFSTTKLN